MWVGAGVVGGFEGNGEERWDRFEEANGLEVERVERLGEGRCRGDDEAGGGVIVTSGLSLADRHQRLRRRQEMDGRRSSLH